MSIRPLRHPVGRPALDPAVGRTDDDRGDETGRRNLLADRALYVPLTEWSVLGRNDREFVTTLLAYLHEGKGALVHTLGASIARHDCALDDDTRRVVEQIIDHQAIHARAARTLRERIAERHGEDEVSSPNVGPLSRFLGAVSRPIDEMIDGDRAGEPDDMPLLAVAVTQIGVGVLGRTGYRALSVFLRRNDVLTDFADLLDALRRSDRELVETIDEFRARLRRRRPEIERRIDDRVDASIVSCVGLIREVQSQFDLLSIGVVPDEFVADALERFFEIGPDS